MSLCRPRGPEDGGKARKCVRERKHLWRSSSFVIAVTVALAAAPGAAPSHHDRGPLSVLSLRRLSLHCSRQRRRFFRLERQLVPRGLPPLHARRRQAEQSDPPRPRPRSVARRQQRRGFSSFVARRRRRVPAPPRGDVGRAAGEWRALVPLPWYGREGERRGEKRKSKRGKKNSLSFFLENALTFSTSSLSLSLSLSLLLSLSLSLSLFLILSF